MFVGFLAASPSSGNAQVSYVPLGEQYAIAGALAGDQNHPQVALNGSGGYLVWQDAFTDGSGLGISARRINSTLSGEFGVFRVNQIGAGDQERPQVAMLNNGGAVFVWQGGREGFQDIFARFLAADGTFATGDIRVNTFTNGHQAGPAVAGLADGNAVVMWTSFDQDGSMQGVYAQRLSPAGAKLGAEFRVNATTLYNQRTPAVAGLANGNFAAVWVNEFVNTSGNITNTSQSNTVVATAQVYGRLFNASGAALGGEFRANISTNPICANPAIAPLPGGGFTVSWNQRDWLVRSNGWDVWARPFNASAVALAAPARLNQHTGGDQFTPRLGAIGADQLAVWSSMGQDGSYEGVFARVLTNGAPADDECRVNTDWISKQVQPAVASDGAGRFLVVWSGFTNVATGFDLSAQRYVNASPPPVVPPAPFVWSPDAGTLSVTWAELSGYSGLLHYELYVDNGPTPIVTTESFAMVTGLAAGSTHTFNLAYRFTDGSLSALSPTASGTTRGPDDNGDGLPDDWQQAQWGANPALWPPPNVDSDGDGANNYQEFLAGTNPKNPASVLRMRITSSVFSPMLHWTTQPGFIYQVQRSENFAGWTSYGLPRFAVGTNDSVAIPDSTADPARRGFYRVIRVR
jgi:hypothetical protein